MSNILSQSNSVNIVLEAIYPFSIFIAIGFAFNMLRGVSQRFGSMILLNFITGKYRKPVLDEEIFMFLDLANSTALAEKMEYKQFAYFLQDYYLDIGLVIEKYDGNVYQLISKKFYSLVQPSEKYNYAYLGDFKLKGKEELTGIYAVEQK